MKNDTQRIPAKVPKRICSEREEEILENLKTEYEEKEILDEEIQDKVQN